MTLSPVVGDTDEYVLLSDELCLLGFGHEGGNLTVEGHDYTVIVVLLYKSELGAYSINEVAVESGEYLCGVFVCSVKVLLLFVILYLDGLVVDFEYHLGTLLLAYFVHLDELESSQVVGGGQHDVVQAVWYRVDVLALRVGSLVAIVKPSHSHLMRTLLVVSQVGQIVLIKAGVLVVYTRIVDVNRLYIGVAACHEGCCGDACH